MAEITTAEIKEYLFKIQGHITSLAEVRREFNISQGSKSFDAVRNIMFQLAEQKIVVPLTRRGEYKVVLQVKPVQVFGEARERRPPYDLRFPRDFTSDMELSFAEFIVIRAGDLITIGGTKSSGKTQLCLSFCAENIDSLPVLMGNEYTIQAEGKHEPAPRFLDRLDRMSEWVQWTNGDGMDKFTLLPVSEDYAEHIINGRINIADWIDLGGDRLFDIGKILKGIKNNNGRGISIAALQKGAGAIDPRGSQFVRDYSDLEIILDPLGKNPHDVLLTIRGAKETTKPIVGKTYAYTVGEAGTKMFNFREVKKCKGCMGSGFVKGHDCDECYGTGWRDAKSSGSSNNSLSVNCPSIYLLYNSRILALLHQLPTFYPLL